MDNKINVEIIRSNRKSISIEIRPDLTLLVWAPLSMEDMEIQRLLKKKENWIRTHLKKAEARQEMSKNIEKLSSEELQQLADKASKIIPERVKYYANLMAVRYGRITIRKQKTRWGSCSNKGNLNFNCLLMLTPNEVIDYVVVHELCHLMEMNHSKAFWTLVEQVMPDYKEHKKWLRDYGGEIMVRMM